MLTYPFEPCIPTRGAKVPSGPDWIHEIKHDGYRLIVQRDGDRVRLFTRNGHDWTPRYPRIVEAALRLRATSYVIDGEAVLLGADGVSDFNGLHSVWCFLNFSPTGGNSNLTERRFRHFWDQTEKQNSRKHDASVQLYAFDALVADGEDLRKLPLTLRKTNLARLLARRVDGIHLAPFEQGEVSPDLFRHACKLGLEGLVSKHRASWYRAGRSEQWIKVKNRTHPAFSRVLDAFG